MPVNVGYLGAERTPASDLMFTPSYAVEPLLEYLKPGQRIWCPFDTEKSEYVKVFERNGYEVIHTHINDGQNFLLCEPPPNYDVIITNPAFSIKYEVLKRLKLLGKPFALLFPLPSIQGQKVYPFIKDCQLLIFDKRINFYLDEEHTQPQRNAVFATVYVCKDFLPQPLVWRLLNKHGQP